EGGHVDLPDALARLMGESGLDAGALSRRLAGDEAAAGAVSAGQAGSAAFARDPEGRAREVARLLDVAARARAAAPATADGEEVRAVAAARELEPSAPGVVDAIGRLLPQARGCHAEAMRQNRLREASACLDARAALGDDAGAVAEARRQLAAGWPGARGGWARATPTPPGRRWPVRVAPTRGWRRSPASSSACAPPPRPCAGADPQAKNTRRTTSRAASAEKCRATFSRPLAASRSQSARSP